MARRCSLCILWLRLLLHALERLIGRALAGEPIAHSVVDDLLAELVIPNWCVLVGPVEVRYIGVSVGDGEGVVGDVQMVDDLECAVRFVHG